MSAFGPPTGTRTSLVAGGVAAALSAVVAAFEAALAAGAPWGAAAWGGQHEQLGPGLRVASGVAAVVWVGVAAVASRQGGWPSPAPVPDRWLRRTTIGLAAYTGVGVLLNLASGSDVERAIWVPVSALLAVSLGVAAARGRRPVTG